MRNLFSFLIFITLQSCNGQDKSIVIVPNEVVMNTKKFNVEQFRKCQQANSTSICEEKLPNGMLLIYSSSRSSKVGLTFTKIYTPPPPELYSMIEDYYPTGIIKRETKSFIGTLMVAPFYNSLIVKEYDEEGKLVKTIDNSNFDKNVGFKFDALLELLQNEPIVKTINPEQAENYSVNFFKNDLSKEEVSAEKIISYLKSKEINGKILNVNSDVDRRNVTISLEKNEWLVTKDVYPNGYFDYIFDANTGLLKDSSYRADQRP